ncbi:glycosyltransferase family 8 protein [Algoriphagus yeomjeoni]|uniref:glycosyltransferase family 8 protein n=1 Tax=Algoriphagus yeomjeoni TaxID=291403 RepID=UPI003CE4D959
MATKELFELPIVFCADGKFISHAMTTMLSVIRANPNNCFQFYLLASALPESKKTAISNKVISLGSKFDFIKIDDNAFENFPIPHHFSKANYFRLLIPELLPAKKVIYLDADIIVVSPLNDFLKIDLTDHSLAAVEDPIYKWKTELGMKNSSTYFNSGVMLMNLELWKQRDISKKAFEFINTHPEKIRFVDQCALNAVIDGDYIELAPKFNQQAILFKEGFDFGQSSWSKEQREEAIDSPILLHFTGPSKPWQYNNSHPRKKEYWKIQKDSPFKMRYPEGMVWSDHIKSLFPNSLKNKLKSLLRFN